MEQWESEIDTVFRSQKSPIARYIYEKHQTGLVEICRIETKDNEAGIELTTDAAAHFEVMIPEVRRLCLELAVYMKMDMWCLKRAGEAQCGNEPIGVRTVNGKAIRRRIYNAIWMAEDDRLLVMYRFWEPPYLLVTSGLDGPQINFRHWTDRWWVER